MNEFKNLSGRRKVRQLVMAVGFLALVAASWLWPLAGLLIPACMVGGMAVALSKGRLWCGSICLRGAFLERLSMVSSRREFPAWMSTTGFRIGFMAVLMAIMTAQVYRAWPDPVAIGRAFAVILTVTTVAGVVLAFLFLPRAWCRICPIGSIATWSGKLKKPVVNLDTCKKCAACEKVCPMLLAPEKNEHGDCVGCNLCVTRCPIGALHEGR